MRGAGRIVVKEKVTLRQGDVIRFLQLVEPTFSSELLEAWAKRDVFDVSARSGGKKVYTEADLVALRVCLAAMPRGGTVVTREVLATLRRDPERGRGKMLILASPSSGTPGTEVFYDNQPETLLTLASSGRGYLAIPVGVFCDEAAAFVKDLTRAKENAGA